MTHFSRQFEQYLLSMDRLSARKLVADHLKEMNSLEIVDQIIVPSLSRIGESWEQGDVALSQVYMSGRICEELVDGLLPPGDSQRKDQPPMAIAALDDYHLLGKRIVYSVLRSAGYDLKDYGRITAEEAVGRIKEDRICVFLISTLMLHSALRVRDVVAGLRKAGLAVKVIVGGAPFRFDEKLWREVEADAMGYSAADARKVVVEMLGGLS